MSEPAAFMTLEQLSSFSGQVMIVMMLTQAVKSAVPTILVYPLRLVAVVCGVALHGMLVWRADMPLVAYVLAFVNGLIVAMVAMKSAEMIKGSSETSEKE